MGSFRQKALLYLSACVWTLALMAMGVGIPTGFWRPIGIVSVVLTIVLFIYDRWGWSWIPTKISGVPDLRGTWCGKLASNWNDPTTSAKLEPIEAYFVVAQTASTIEVTMMTKESRSTTIISRLEKRDGAVQLIGVYRNEPSASVRDRSPIHHGGLRLVVGGPPPKSMHGDYWTDRSTTGEIKIELGSKTKADDFATAQALSKVGMA